MANNKWEKVETSPTWNFKEDTELEGTYVGAEAEVGPNKSNLYTFKKEDSNLIAVWGNTILDMRFKNLEVGDDVKIVYLGKVTNEKTNRSYNNFDVFHRKSDILPEVDISDEPNPSDLDKTTPFDD